MFLVPGTVYILESLADSILSVKHTSACGHVCADLCLETAPEFSNVTGVF